MDYGFLTATNTVMKPILVVKHLATKNKRVVVIDKKSAGSCGVEALKQMVDDMGVGKVIIKCDQENPIVTLHESMTAILSQKGITCIPESPPVGSSSSNGDVESSNWAPPCDPIRRHGLGYVQGRRNATHPSQSSSRPTREGRGWGMIANRFRFF